MAIVIISFFGRIVYYRVATFKEEHVRKFTKEYQNFSRCTVQHIVERVTILSKIWR